MSTGCGGRGWFTGAILAFLAFHFTIAGASQPGIWKTYTSKKDVRDVVIYNGTIWAATRGGLFSVAVTDSVYKEFTTSEGLLTNDLSAITVDRFGAVWTGSVNGMIHAYNPSLSQWRYVRAIANRSEGQKEIKTLLAIGDTLYIGSEIGFHSYIINRDEFRIDARRFGSGLEITGNVLAIAYYRDSLWLGTTSGIAVASRSHPNLSAPASWRVWQAGLPSNRVTSFTIYRDVLYAATANGLVRYDGSTWIPVSGTSGKEILGVLSNQNLMYCVTTNELLEIDTSESVTTISTPSSLTSLAIEGSDIVLGSSNSGLYVRRLTTWEPRLPQGPSTNSIIGLAVDRNGVLWAGTGTAAGGVGSELGFMSFDGRQWRSYNVTSFPQLQSNAYYRVDIGKDNVKWVSSYGVGVALVGNDGEIKKVFSRANGLPLTIGQDFVVVGGVVTDREGKAWICIRSSDTALVVVSDDSIVSYVVRSQLGGDPRFGDIAIDAYGTKWIVESRFSPGTGAGVYFYNERGFGDNDPSTWRRLSDQDGLASNKTTAIAVDHSGQIWVGTDNGISIVVNPYFIGSGGRLRPQLAFYTPLSGQQINTITVDPLNYKWVGTNQGVFVLSPDGISILAQYSVENTNGKLVANNVQSIAIDPHTGTAYIGSESGLSTLTTASVEPVSSMDELLVLPNPFYLPASSSLVIDGLAQNSSLKILSIDGHLVKQVNTPGGRVGYWDGTDAGGNLVSSGVYLIVAFSENGNEVAVGKVAVIRR